MQFDENKKIFKKGLTRAKGCGIMSAPYTYATVRFFVKYNFVQIFYSIFVYSTY